MMDVAEIVRRLTEIDARLRRRTLSTTTPGAADQEFRVPHHLGRKPQGWIIVSQDKPARVYEGPTDNTDQYLYLRCDTENTALTVEVF